MTIYYNGTFSKYVDESVNGKSEMPEGRRSSRRSSGGWAGKDWETARELALNGDIETAKNIKAEVVRSAEYIASKLPKYDIEFRPDGGAFIDIARFVDGVPECWSEFVECGKTISPEISIAFNVTFNSNERAEDIARLGAKFAGLVLGLQASGVTVRPIVYFDITNNGKVCQQIIELYGCNVSQIAVAFSPYFLRRIQFSWDECQDSKFRSTFDIGGGYGRALNNKIEIPVDICVSNSNEVVSSDSAWEKLINQVKEKIGKGQTNKN